MDQPLWQPSAERVERANLTGLKVKNIEALANPGSLALYRDLRELSS